MEYYYKDNRMLPFGDWLLKEMEKRGWSQSDLSRRSGIAQSTISTAISGRKRAGKTFCIGMAKAFGYPPELVMRAAGFLPQVSDIALDFEKFSEILPRLTPEQREQLLKIGWIMLDTPNGKPASLQDRTKNSE